MLHEIPVLNNQVVKVSSYDPTVIVSDEFLK